MPQIERLLISQCPTHTAALWRCTFITAARVCVGSACMDSRCLANPKAMLTWQIQTHGKANGACNQVEKLADAIDCWSWVILVASSQHVWKSRDYHDSPQWGLPPADIPHYKAVCLNFRLLNVLRYRKSLCLLSPRYIHMYV